MSDLPTISGLFEGYRTMVIPDGAHPSQIKETRRAFYAAAFGVISALLDAAGEADVEKGSKYLDGLHAECLSFVTMVKAGMA